MQCRGSDFKMAYWSTVIDFTVKLDYIKTEAHYGYSVTGSKSRVKSTFLSNINKFSFHHLHQVLSSLPSVRKEKIQTF